MIESMDSAAISASKLEGVAAELAGIIDRLKVIISEDLTRDPDGEPGDFSATLAINAVGIIMHTMADLLERHQGDNEALRGEHLENLAMSMGLASVISERFCCPIHLVDRLTSIARYANSLAAATVAMKMAHPSEGGDDLAEKPAKGRA